MIAIQTRHAIPSLMLVMGLFCFAHPATAHPLGNFSISQYSRIRINREFVEVRYIIDMAEIPTFQELQESGIALNAKGAEVESYLARKTGNLRDGLLLEINGRRMEIVAESSEIIFPPGAGGLPTLKIAVTYKAVLSSKRESAVPYELYYQDRNFSGRAGWKEVIAIADPGVTLVQSSVEAAERSNQLSNYPTDLLDNPPQDLAARLVFNLPTAAPRIAGGSSKPASTDKRAVAANAVERAILAPGGDPRELRAASEISGAASAPAESAAPVTRPPDRPLQPSQRAPARDSFTELIATERLGVGIMLVALAVAAGLGAFHALEPGHGKTLVAAYLVGSRGTFKHALLLGLIVTAAHTAGVYLLGGVTLYASHYIIPEKLYPLLGVISGIVIAILGAILAIQRFRTKGSHHQHRRGGLAEQHHHGHAHEYDHHHTDHGHHHHGTASGRELLALGISGGIIPCPAALVVLLSAVSMNRLSFGLLLIVAFSAGLAAVLIAIGLLMVYARRFMSRVHGDRPLTTRWLPMTSAAFIFFFGIALTLQALQTAAP